MRTSLPPPAASAPRSSAHASFELPAGHKDVAPSLSGCIVKSTVIVSAVDQEAGPVNMYMPRQFLPGFRIFFIATPAPMILTLRSAADGRKPSW